jgi:arginase
VGGPTLEQLEAALRVAVADPRWRALTVGELNPTRSAGDPDAVPRFAAALARILACA